MPLFGFRLRPLPEIIQGWRDGGLDAPQYLQGWFWLTDGWYWIATPQGDVPLIRTPVERLTKPFNPSGASRRETGSGRGVGNPALFRVVNETDGIRISHPAFNAAFDLPPDPEPHLDHQVARLWLDLADILPDVLEPLPADLGELLASGAWDAWQSALRRWSGALEDDDPRGDWDVQFAALAWAGARTLDMGYLKAPPMIRFWRVEDTVTVSWDTRDRRVNGALCWLETCGRLTLSAAQFQAEVRDLRARLDSDMQARLQEVAALDLLDGAAQESLARQHRSTLFPPEGAAGNRGGAQGVTWDEVRAAIRQLETWSGLPLR